LKRVCGTCRVTQILRIVGDKYFFRRTDLITPGTKDIMLKDIMRVDEVKVNLVWDA
jgi:hypothetical protein